MRWTMVVMEDIPVYAIDFEGSLQTGILEYGIVGFTPREGIFFTETQLCRNKTAIPANEFSCHGLCAENLASHEDFSKHLSTFIDLRKKALFCAIYWIKQDLYHAIYCGFMNYSLNSPSTSRTSLTNIKQ